MNHFDKSVCVIDTCSIINLDNIILNKKDILFYIRNYFTLHVCESIKKEFERHKDKVTTRESSFWNRYLSIKSYIPTIINSDEKHLSNFYTLPPTSFDSENAGERGNARVAIELLLKKETGHVVFITDDDNASNSFLLELSNIFPSIKIWKSADIIMYLGGVLLYENKATYNDIHSAIRDIFAKEISWSQASDKKKDKIIKQREIWRKKLNKLNELNKLL